MTYIYTTFAKTPTVSQFGNLSTMDGKRPLIMCANCNICVNTLRKYHILEQDTRVCTTLCNWIYPQIATDDDYVCEPCLVLAKSAANKNLQQNTDNDQEAGTSQRGHTHVCVLCGCSLKRKQSDKILRDDATELQQAIIEIIKRRKEPQQITSTDKVCHGCWLQSKREALRKIKATELRSGNGSSVELEDVDVVGNISEVYARGSIAEDQSIEDSNNVDDASQLRSENLKPGTILLPNYRRAANSTNRCLFPNCLTDGRLHGVSDKLRAIILSNNNFYVPKLARVCRLHLFRNSWDDLYQSENSINVFNVDHVQHIFSFVNTFNPTLDFENIEGIEEHVFEYWVGLSKEEFNNILEEIPRILECKHGRLGLVTLLLKLRTKDSNEKIAALMQKPRRTLETYMKQVREILQDSLPKDLDITQT